MRTIPRMLLGVLAMTAWADAGTVKTFHVSPDGCDKASGTWWRPFATFERAQQAVAEFKARCPAEEIERIEVSFRGGTYPLTQPVRIRPEHGGTATFPVVYRARGGTPPVFTGGRAITGWTVRADGAWTVQLPEVKSGTCDFAQLFVNGTRRFRPRVPRKGYFTATNDFEAVKDGVNGFFYREDGLDPSWSNLQDIEFHTLHIWSASRVRPKSIDARRKIVRFLKTRKYSQYWGSYKGPGWGEDGCRFWAENVKEAFGTPGEWYLDRPTGTLSYMPEPGESPDRARVEAPALSQLLIVEGDADRPVINTRIEGLVFRQTRWATPEAGNFIPQAEVNIPAAAEFVHARNVMVSRCVFTQLAGYALAFGPGSHSNTVDACIMADLGAGGVKIGPPYAGYSMFESTRNDFHSADEVKVSDKTSAITVSNCRITGGGRIHPAAIGVWVGHASHNRILSNEISDFYYSSVSLGWTWGYAEPSRAHHNEVAFNHMHRIGQGVLSDMGGVYTLGVSPGTTVHDNRIHDINAFTYGGWGLYTDQGSSHIRMYNNLVYNTKTGSFDQNFGRENIIENNIFANAVKDQIQRSQDEEHISFFIRNNILYWDNDGNLLGNNWKSGTRGIKDGKPTQHYELGPNLYWHTSGKQEIFPGKETLAQWQAETGQDAGSLVADPLFENPAAGDFRLKPGSPAAKIGFKPFDASAAGPGKSARLPEFELRPVPTMYEITTP
ncbi:MAG: hypothetical protein RBT78_08470 [Kiritimatiellia bacterium]|nr:hypothetical protein [Kiritimatiellia bacterium]